jgi:hypothetical protein
VLHLARLSAIRRIRQALGAAERAEAAAAIGHGATYPMLAAAAVMARQTAWKRYRPGRTPDQHGTGKGAAPGRRRHPEVTKGILANSLLPAAPVRHRACGNMPRLRAVERHDNVSGNDTTMSVPRHEMSVAPRSRSAGPNHHIGSSSGD